MAEKMMSDPHFQSTDYLEFLTKYDPFALIEKIRPTLESAKKYGTTVIIGPQKCGKSSLIEAIL